MQMLTESGISPISGASHDTISRLTELIEVYARLKTLYHSLFIIRHRAARLSYLYLFFFNSRRFVRPSRRITQSLQPTCGAFDVKKKLAMYRLRIKKRQIDAKCFRRSYLCKRVCV